MRTRRIAVAGLIITSAATAIAWDQLGDKRVAVVEPRHILRGAWPKPAPLLRLIQQHSIRTIVTLTAINRDDPKYIAQETALRETGVDWRIIPGSTASLDQMAEGADLVANPARQPVFFHCVGGHHRSNLVHAAYLIRHKQYSAEAAWNEIKQLPWTRPDAAADRDDHRMIVAFAEREAARQ